MIALIDIGNSRSKYTFIEHEKRQKVNNVANKRFTNAYLDKEFHLVSRIVVASVAKESITDLIKNWCDKHDKEYNQVQSEQKKNGVISAYDTPDQLGVDRWLVLIAAAKLYPKKNILIVDAGTATTIDLIASSGEHQGGLILAGIESLLARVVDKTNHVKAKPSAVASTSFATNTNENVNNACWAATVGAIELAFNQAKQKLPYIDEVILTGGNAHALETLLTMKCLVIDDLIFYGLEAYC